MHSLSKFFMATTLIFTSQLGYAQVVVVGAKSPATTLSKDQVAALFLGKSTQLPGAGIPVLYDHLEAAEIRQQFYTKVTDKTPSQVKAVWSRLVFSGKGSPPKEVASSADVKKAVSANPDAVGYIEKSAVDSSVKVVFSAD